MTTMRPQSIFSMRRLGMFGMKSMDQVAQVFPVSEHVLKEPDLSPVGQAKHNRARAQITTDLDFTNLVPSVNRTCSVRDERKM